MLRYDGSYSSYYRAPDSYYPEGSAIDSSSDETLDGTPYKKGFFNDVIGFMQAIFHRAFGNPHVAGSIVTRDVSGASDNAVSSDALDALDAVIDSHLPSMKVDYEAASESLNLSLSFPLR